MIPASMNMRSVVINAPGDVRLTERPQPTPSDDEVMLRVRRVGVCGTDLHMLNGTRPEFSYPRVIGHELAGEVVSAPPASGLLPGQEVYVLPFLSCGSCAACRRGDSSCCKHIEVLGVHRDGGMAEFLTVPARFVYRTEGLSLDEAAMLEFLASGAHAVRRAGLRNGQRVLVVGAGPSGIAAALFARLKGAAVTLLEARPERQAFCRHVLGLPVVAAGESDVAELWNLTGGGFFDVVFDATGEVAAIERGLGFVACGGTYVLVSAFPGRVSFPDPELQKREVTLIASRHATPEDFREVVAAIKAGKLPTRAMNTHRATLSSLASVLPHWTDPSSGVIKAIVEV